ncbi:hypothetical protein HDU76_007979 [Blyttiomyces sp. JEL0837]|nr:hypothetical protein HDU76_007979 [Blyttiomyces sp. JEL0837]
MASSTHKQNYHHVGPSPTNSTSGRSSTASTIETRINSPNSPAAVDIMREKISSFKLNPNAKEFVMPGFDSNPSVPASPGAAGSTMRSYGSVPQTPVNLKSVSSQYGVGTANLPVASSAPARFILNNGVAHGQLIMNGAQPFTPPDSSPTSTYTPTPSSNVGYYSPDQSSAGIYSPPPSPLPYPKSPLEVYPSPQPTFTYAYNYYHDRTGQASSFQLNTKTPAQLYAPIPFPVPQKYLESVYPDPHIRPIRTFMWTSTYDAHVRAVNNAWDSPAQTAYVPFDFEGHQNSYGFAADETAGSGAHNTGGRYARSYTGATKKVCIIV